MRGLSLLAPSARAHLPCMAVREYGGKGDLRAGCSKCYDIRRAALNDPRQFPATVDSDVAILRGALDHDDGAGGKIGREYEHRQR